MTHKEALEREELFDAIAHRFARNAMLAFGTLYESERKDEATVRNMSVIGSPAFEILYQALNETGMWTDGTVGSIMSVLDLSKKDIDKLVCSSFGDEVTGKMVGERFAKLARI